MLHKYFKAMRKRAQILCVLFIFVFTHFAHAEFAPKIKVSDTPPPGFEDLVRPQTTQVDVFYGNEKVGSALATFTPESITLDSPPELVALIPYLIDPIVIIQTLTGPLDTNASAVCVSELQRQCGVIEPNVAGVIFDESRFHLHVFVNRLQLQPQGIVSNKFLPKIKIPKPSSVNAFSTSFSGEDGDVAYTSAANHIIAYGQSRFQAQWDYSDTRDFSIETLSFQNDNAGIAKEAGFFDTDTRFSSFTNNLDILGGRIYSSTKTRTDLDYSQATEIYLFLNSRSQVEVFKDEKLIDGGFYEAGNQQLNTLRLPSGSYPISIRITESSGDVREEQFFFVKTTILPPQDQPLHYFELGVLEKDDSDDTLPELSNSELLRIGTAYRLQNQLGGSIEYLHSPDTDLIQGNVSYFGPGFVLQNSLMLGTDGEWGMHFLSQYRREHFALNLDYRQINSERELFDNDIDTQILPNDFSQGNISASIPLSRGQLTLRSQYNDKANEASRTLYGLEYRYPIYYRNRLSIEANLSAVYEEDDYRVQSGLRISRTKPGQFLNVRPAYLKRESNGNVDQGALLSASVTNTYENTKFGKFSHSGFFNEELDRSTVGVRTDSFTSYGRTDLQLDWVDDDERGSFTRFRGVQYTNVFSDGDQFAFGGDRNSTSGVVIQLTGQAANEPFEIFVNSQPRGFTNTTRNTVIPLDAFQTYSIGIRSLSDQLLSFDETSRKITLYPGNVETLTFDVQPITVLITRILLSDGKPASRVRIENAIGYAVTDEDGWIQAEISGDAPLEVTKQGNALCMINLPELEIKQGIAFVDSIQCKE